MRTLISLMSICLLSSIVLLGGCNSQESTISPDPFILEYLQAEQHIVSMSGDSAGHKAGQESEFTLILTNNHPENQWNGEFAVFVVNDTEILETVTSENFTISPMSQDNYVITTSFEGLSEGAYGLVTLIPDRSQATQTIWIGRKTDQPVQTFYEVPFSAMQ